MFPLPYGALLPGELLPLHVFEPRYRSLLEVARKSDRIIAIATLMPGFEGCDSCHPPVGAVVGVGRLVKDRPNADGTSDIVLHGLVRGEIVHEIDGAPFRRGRLLLCSGNDVHATEMYRLRRELLCALADRLRMRSFVYDVTAGFDVGTLVDRIASSLELQPTERVEILQAVDLGCRIDGLLELLSSRRHRQRLRDIIPSLHAFGLTLEKKRPGDKEGCR